MVTLYEGRAKIEYAKETDTLYISGKKGVIIRIEGLKASDIEDEMIKATMLDIKVEGSTISTIGASSIIEPGD